MKASRLGLSCLALGGGGYAEAFSVLSNKFTTNIQRSRVLHHPHRSSLYMATASSSETSKRAPGVHDPTSIRNVALVGHSHCGKTKLIEWMLYDEHVVSKEPSSSSQQQQQHHHHQTNAESSVLDSDPVESKRHTSVFAHFCRVPHQHALLQVTDTPWGDFPSSALAAVDGADAAVLVVSASDGVQTGTVQAYQHCRRVGIPMLMACNKMDRPFLQVQEALEDMERQCNVKPVPLQVPVGEGEDFEGVVPLFLMDENGVVTKNPAEGLDEVWTTLEEGVAMTDDDLLVEYLENSQLETEQIVRGLETGVLQGKILPLVYTSAERNLGVSELMDAIVAVLPDPLEARKEALDAACASEKGKCGMVPGVEAGFSARVLHTMVDSFGSLSVLRVISNSKNADENTFDSLPSEAVNLRTGDKVKMPSASLAFGLCGKERLPLEDGAHIVPGDVIALPKLPESVHTNDILTVPSAAKEEESEIFIETATNHLTPLSRPVETVTLMTCATISVKEDGKKSRGKSSSGDDKLNNALASLAREDLALSVEHDSASGMLLLRCMSSEHLQLVAARLKDRYGIEVEFGQPPVQYRETLVKAVTNVEGRHKKQSGGSGQFGVCYISMEPLEEGSGIEFESQIKGGAISKPFITSVEKGVREQLQAGGPIAGYPVTDVKVTLTDGKMHSVDSKDIAFQSAGKLAVKAALEKGKTRLLQPMEKVTFMIDEKLQGDINTIVSRHDGYVTSSSPSQDNLGLEVEAILPTAGIGNVSDVLRAASAGEGQFMTEFSHYQPVPEDQVQDIVENLSATATH